MLVAPGQGASAFLSCLATMARSSRS